MIEVETPDGSVAEFPDGTSPDAIRTAMRAKFGGGPARAIAKDMAGGFGNLSKAVTDVPEEIRKTAAGNIETMRQALPQALGGTRDITKEGFVEGLAKTGAGIAAIPALAMSPITGAARSLIGHPLAEGIHAIGTLINPTVAAKDIPDEMYQKAANAAETALSAAGARTGPGKLPKIVAPSTEELKAASDASYKAARGMGVELHPAPVRNLGTQIRQSLEADGSLPEDAPKVFRRIERLENQTGPVSITEVESIRKGLQRAASNPLEGEERFASSHAIEELDKFMSNLTPRHAVVNGQFIPRVVEEMNNARGNWAAAARSETIEEKATRAADQAGASGSGANVNNATRQQLKQILASRKARRGFSAEEIDQMRRVVRGTYTGNVARLIGKLAPTGVVSAGADIGAAAGIIAAGGAPIVAAGVPLAGAVGHVLGNASTARQLRILDELVRSRSPLARSRAATPTAPQHIAPALAPITLGRPSAMDTGSIRDAAGNVYPGGVTPAAQ